MDYEEKNTELWSKQRDYNVKVLNALQAIERSLKIFSQRITKLEEERSEIQDKEGNKRPYTER